MIVGTSLFSAARSETLTAVGGTVAGGELGSELKRRFGLSLGSALPHEPCGAVVVDACASAVAAATVSVGDLILAVNGVALTDADAVQEALLGAADTNVQVTVRSPASLESAYEVRAVLGKGKQGFVVRAVSRGDGTEVAVKTISTARPCFNGLMLSPAMISELAAYQDDLLRREVDLVCARQLAPSPCPGPGAGRGPNPNPTVPP